MPLLCSARRQWNEVCTSMAFRWLSNAFQRFLSLFSGNQQEEEEETPNEALPAGKREARVQRSREPNEELFDNEWRREAEEHARLRAKCYKKADEARNGGDHATANEYVNKVMVWVSRL